MVKRQYFVNRETRYEFKEHKFCWREVFRAIATRLELPHTSGVISLYLGDYLKEARRISKPGSLTEEHRAVVKTQLGALGLIKYYQSKATDGKMYEFVDLTPQGRKVITEMLVVKAGEPAT